MRTRLNIVAGMWRRKAIPRGCSWSLVATIGIILTLPLPQADGQEVLQVRSATNDAANPPALPKAAADWLPAFRLATKLLPESEVMSLILQQPAVLGIPAAEASRLAALFVEEYRRISIDPIFNQVPSAIPYCYAAEKNHEGLALVYHPKVCDAETPCLVFLHGYGGDFLWCLHVLAEALPDALIICPAYGISAGNIPARYVTEAMKAVEQRLGHAMPKPSLVGLSAGGFGASQLYVESPTAFRRLVVLAAYPPEATWSRFRAGMNTYFLAGAREGYVQSGYFPRAITALRAAGAKAEMIIMPNADHYFLLENREETEQILKAWLR